MLLSGMNMMMRIRRNILERTGKKITKMLVFYQI